MRRLVKVLGTAVVFSIISLCLGVVMALIVMLLSALVIPALLGVLPWMHYYFSHPEGVLAAVGIGTFISAAVFYVELAGGDGDTYLLEYLFLPPGEDYEERPDSRAPE